MKVLVVALDGLEYNLVTRWRMKGLMQRYYGKHDVTVAVRPGEPLYTPYIWASFLLGKPSYELGFDIERFSAKRSLHGFPAPLRLLYRLRVALLGKRELGLRKLLIRLGLYDLRRVARVAAELEKMPEELIERSLVGSARRLGYRVWYKEFPSLGDPSFAGHRAGILTQYLDRGFEERKVFLEKLLKRAEEDFREAVERLEDHDLVLYYTPLPDEAHHLVYRPGRPRYMLLLRSIYGRLDNMVREAAKRLENGVAVLVVSDHGYDPAVHDHSPYGFWSLNVKPPFTPRRVTDFHSLILNILEG